MLSYALSYSSSIILVLMRYCFMLAATILAFLFSSPSPPSNVSTVTRTPSDCSLHYSIVCSVKNLGQLSSTCWIVSGVSCLQNLQLSSSSMFSRNRWCFSRLCPILRRVSPVSILLFLSRIKGKLVMLGFIFP